MPAFITQVDLSLPIAPIQPHKRYGSTWVLVRVGRQPLGWVKCARSRFGHMITPDMLHNLISEQLSLQVLDAARRRAFEEPKELHTPGISVVICTREHPDVL